jgi:predicted flap endonuclease-1-like 5' DNA nuclease
VRTATRRARRLGGLLLLAGTLWWAFLRRRANAVTWAEPPATPRPEPGAPEALPDDVIATDAGLTELPAQDAVDGPGTVDEARVAELLAESPGTEVLIVDETVYEEALAGAAPEPVPSTPDLPEPGPAADEPTDPELGAAVDEGTTETGLAGPAAEEKAAGEGGLGAPAEEKAADEVAATGPSAAQPAGAAAVVEPTETERAAPGVDEPTMTIRVGAGAEDDETGTRIPMPTFSEAPTMEIPAVSDNLRAVRGIGPSMERMLHGLGIVSFRQLAMLDGAELERVRGELSDFRSRIEREDWVGQARALYREKYGRDPS